MNGNINIYIERLILDGISVPHAQRPLLQAAVEAELARLLAVDGLSSPLQADSVLPRISAGDIQLNSDNNPTQLGQQIAQAVYRGIRV